MSALKHLQLDISPEIEALLRQLYEKELLLDYLEEQKLALQLAREAGTARSVNGIGAKTHQIPLGFFLDQAVRYGGAEVWNDPVHKRMIRDRCPEVLVKSTGTRTQVGFQAPSQFSNKRWVKSYGDHRRSDPV